MSLRLKTELLLRLGPRRCSAECWRAGWSRQPAAQAVAEGEGDLVAQVLAQLVREGARLPRRARLVVADESLYYALLPADPGWGDPRDQARRYFDGALSPAPLHVALSLLPGGCHWLAVAVEASRIEAVRQALSAHDLALGSVDAALLRDLDTLQRQLPANGAVAMVRDAGAVLLLREAGRWTELAWERCDGWRPEAVAARVDAQLYRLRQRAAEAQPAPAVMLVAQHARQARLLDALARERGWQLGVLGCREIEEAA